MSDEDDTHPLWDWSDVLDQSSYYELLSVLEIADDDAIKTAFHAFARSFHPDGFMGDPEELRAVASRVFERGAEAYRVLSSPKLRAAYDRALERGELRLTPGGVGEISTLPRGALSLVALCKTPAGKLKAKLAQERLDADDLRGAHTELQLAIAAEADDADPELVERLDAIDLVMFASGD